MTTEEQTAENSVDLDYALAAAIRLHQSGQLDQAEALYQAILEAFPQCPEALHFFGLLRHQQGDSDAAIRLIEQALVEAPQYSDAYNNLGNIYNKLEQFEHAAEAYGKALDLNPDNAAAYSNFGIVLGHLLRFEEAVEAFTMAVSIMPENSEFYRNLGNVFKKQGDFAKSAAAYRKVLCLKPYQSDNYENLCLMLYLLGHVEEAILLIKQWLELDPENPLALHRWAAYTGELSQTRASDDYIRQTFDAFSDSFDMVLKRLEYKAPFLVADAVKEIYQVTGQALTILDAGCGTGLCGPLLKPYAKQIVGVDLSAKMLEKAEKRDCYDELIASELTAFIQAHPASYDVIVSADTLVYFGDLSDVAKAAAAALLPGGHLIFTVERSEQPLAQGYAIHPHGRFSHTEDYLRRVINSAGLTIKKLDRVMLRYEVDAQVDGFLLVAGYDSNR
ncbi:tetratricopeptide repeat protein [Methylomonas montana]|uniref:tetratricopeptide repeat protein n=1 Tax=Methylomonas montana TaxID=3058963 RepID=UPI00265865FB|nr:tetratricopeptide repeat protein [Methylomonas montana]WKJ90887.1 tetratricopeptide repeat protein [Methylomonas montana]